MGVDSRMIVGALLLACASLPRAISFVVRGPSAFSDRFVRFELGAARRRASDDDGDDDEIFVLSFDGAVGLTADARAAGAVEAALETWPFLRERYVAEGDQSWLRNKIRALLHATESNDVADTGAVLLARLLLEEQDLDGARSVGKTGKYASRFHPRSASTTTTTTTTTMTDEEEANMEKGTTTTKQTGSSVGSRPLTVGEIAANWSEGAELVDTLAVRYNVDGRNPFPVVRENLLRIANGKSINDRIEPLPLVPSIANALKQCDKRVYVLVPHDSQIPVVQASLLAHGIAATIVPTTMTTTNETKNDDDRVVVTIVAPLDDSETQTRTIQRLVSNSKRSANIVVVQSVLNVLKECKRLFGDDSPLLTNGFGNSVVGDDVRLSLCLPTWADNVDPSQHNDAMMDPWLNTMSEEALVARLSSSSSSQPKERPSR